MASIIAALFSHPHLRVESSPYGKHPNGDGKQVTLYTLTNTAPGGVEIKVIDYGAIIVSVMQPDNAGVKKNVVLGYDHLEAWVAGKPWINSLVGRHANRITGGLFSLDGESYQLERNNLGNHLHGGANGFNAKCMSSKVLSLATDPVSKLKYVGVEMTFVSPDGDEGYPGELAVTTRFKLLEDNTLQMDFLAQLQGRDDQPKSTIVNLCNHAYWNLNGTDGRQGILSHTLRINALARTELDDKETMLPTGRIIPLSDTPYDFSKDRPIGGELMASLDKILPSPAGYDNNFVLLKDHIESPSNEKGGLEGWREVDVDGSEQRLSFAARLADPTSGRVMAVYTTAPGVQVYTGNFLDGQSVVGREGVAYAKNAGVCLETQNFPDAINHHSSSDAYKNYPSGILRRGEKYVHVTQHKFTTVKEQTKA